MSFELPGLGTSSADVLSTTSLPPVFTQNTLTTSLTGLAGASQSLLFVDRSVTDYQQLVAGVTPGTEIHVLDPVLDAVTQITNTLLGRQNIGSLHIVSHGEAGGLDFGSSQLNLGDLPGYASQLQSWGNALTNDADILLYGCDVAQGELGKTFVNIISQVTGADVAASNNLTGKDGDWNLEVTTGKIESPLVFDSKVTSAYAYDLNILGDTFSGSDVVNHSWIYNTTGTQPFLTARFTTAASAGGIPGGGSDAVGSGALRLTSADGDQASFVIYNRPINASSGLSITFNIHAYDGDGADGISFFLIDGNASPTQAGAVGGSLGYSGNSTTLGLAGGYLGIGFDEFGNFSNPVYGAGGPGQTPDSIAVHGSEANGYKYLEGTETLPEGIDTPGNSRSAAQKKVQIDLTPAGLLSLKIDLNNDGDFLDNNETPAALQNYNVVDNNGALPSTFKFGFSASTGGSTNIHEITGLNVDTFGGVPYTPLVNFTSTSGSVSEGAGSLNLTAQIDAVTTNTVVVPVTLSGTAASGTDYTVSNNSITILAGQLTGSITLNSIDNLVAGSDKTAVLTLGTPTGAQLSPQNKVFTATIADNDYSLTVTGSRTYIENTSPIVIAPTTTIAGGAAAPAIDGATVSLGTGFSTAEDRLGIQGQSGTSGAIAGSSITWSYNTTSGVLALSGTDTAAKYQAALQQVVYSDLSNAPSITTRAVAYTINYNSGQQATSTSAINVTAVDEPSVLTVSNTSSYTENAVAGLVAPNLTLTDPDGLDGARVSIGTNFDINDRLGIAGQSGTSGTINGLTWSYDTTKGILSFTGAASATTYQTVLRQVTYSNTSENPIAGDRAIQFALGANLANPDNGHFYEFVNAGSLISWTAARDAAVARNYFGLQGYLVTVTSAAESSFVSSKLQGQGWLGASDAAVEGEWRWVTGPEAGQQFWQGVGTGSPVGGLYNNWNVIEPNNSGNEDYGQFLLNGKWNDLPNSVASISGYVVEYGGLAGDPILQLTGNATVTVTPVNDAYTGGVAVAGTVSENQVLTAVSTISDPDGNGTLTYQWQQSVNGTTWVDVNGATNATFAPNDAQVGQFLRVRGSFVDGGGSTETFTSPATASRIANVNDAPTGSVSISGTVQENAILTASNTLVDADGLGTVTYQWQQSTDGTTWSDISGAINSTLTLNNAQSGKFVRTQASYTDLQGTAETITSAPTASRIANVNDAPTLTGNATLTAVTQNSANPSGSNLTSLFGSLFTDPDTGASLSGLAIVSNTATTQGRWEYSTDGTNWASVGAVADDATALALSATTLVRFVPAIGYNGTPPGLTVRALDNSYSNGFTNGTTRVTVNTTSNGGTTAISSGTPAALNTSVTQSLPNLVWRNSGTGQNAVWQLNNFTLQTAYFLPTVTDANWQIASTADFNSDGIADLLWRNKASGENVIWQMNSTGFETDHFITKVPDASWEIAGTDDFNGDGIADILWRNKASGQNVIWQMKNDFTLQSDHFITQVPDANWQIAGTDDFNGDGIADILWRNKASGQNVIWQMKNDFTLQSDHFITQVPDINWQIAGTDDFNGDGIADILWRNKLTAKEDIWQMNGFSLVQSYQLVDVIDPNWSVKPFVAG